MPPAQGSPSNSLAPPPEGIYRSFEDLLSAVQRVAKDNGYGIVKLRASNYRDSKPTRYDLVCDRGGVKYNSTAKKRNPSTRKIDCPFRAKAVCEVNLGNQWRFVVQEGRHNHEARIMALAPGEQNTQLSQSMRSLTNKIDRITHEIDRITHDVSQGFHNIGQRFDNLEKRLDMMEQHRNPGAVLGGMGGNMSSNMSSNMGSNMGNNMGNNMGSNMGNNMGNNMGGNMGSNMGGNMGGDMGGNMPNSMSNGMGGGLGNAPPNVLESRLNNMEARMAAMESRGLDMPMDEVDSRLLSSSVI